MSARERYRAWWFIGEPETIEQLQARCGEYERRLVAMDEAVLAIEKARLQDISDDALMAECKRRGFGWPSNQQMWASDFGHWK